MSLCRVCSADIVWCLTREGEKIPLDEHEELMPSPPGTPEDKRIQRYRIIETTVPPLIEAVSDGLPTTAMVDHRQICQQPRVV